MKILKIASLVLVIAVLVMGILTYHKVDQENYTADQTTCRGGSPSDPTLVVPCKIATIANTFTIDEENGETLGDASISYPNGTLAALQNAKANQTIVIKPGAGDNLDPSSLSYSVKLGSSPRQCSHGDLAFCGCSGYGLRQYIDIYPCDGSPVDCCING